MKKSLIIAFLVMIGMVVSLNASPIECSKTPVGTQLAKQIEAKNIAKAKTLLEQFKTEVKVYLAKCGNSKDKFEETSIMILTYQDRLSDIESDGQNASSNVDCSNVPDAKAFTTAFASGVASKIEKSYQAYEKASQEYLEHFASHESYEMVYEDSLFHQDDYEAWKKAHK